MGYNPNEVKVEQSAWNLSQSEVEDIANLRRNAKNNFLKGNVQDAYWYTSEIREIIHTDLQTKEDEILDALEQRINKIYIIKTKIINILNNIEDDREDEDEVRIKLLRKELDKANRLHSVEVKKYRRQISEYLGKYGYLTTKKADREDYIKF